MWFYVTITRGTKFGKITANTKDIPTKMIFSPNIFFVPAGRGGYRKCRPEI